MNREIWLMRHGHYQSDGSLTQEGIEQVSKAAEAFKDQNLVIYSSPVTRCMETAAILKNAVVESELYQISWLGKYHMLPKNCLSLLQGETIILVSHQPTLYRIIDQMGANADNFSFSYGLPVKLVF
jgi:phosphohistidine phosphatase SixA